MRRLSRLTPLFSVLALLAACGSGSTTEPEPDPDPDPGPDPFLTLAVTPSAVSVEQGSTGEVTATVTTGGGFSGTPTVTVQGVPTGVSGSVTIVGTSGGVTTATVTFTAAPGAAPGTFTVTVRATGPGVSPAESPVTLTVTEAPDFALSAAPATLSAVQGGSATSQISLARTNLADPVLLVAEGAPADVAVAFSPQPASGATSEATIAVGAAAPVGTHTLTVRGTAGSLERTTTLELTISAGAVGDFALSVTPSTLQLPAGTGGQATVEVTRSGGFTGPVSLGVAGAPSGLSAVLASTSAVGASVALDVSASGTLAPGTWDLTVTGNAPGIGERQATLTVEVTAVSGAPVLLDFGGCEFLEQPIWFAYQDGPGAPWTEVTGSGHVYEVAPTGPRVGIAWVYRLFAGSETTEVRYMSAGELADFAADIPCDWSGRSVSGSIVNTPNDFVGGVGMGGRGEGAFPTGPTTAEYQLRGIPDGPQDLLVHLGTTSVGVTAADRVMVRRDLNFADGEVLPVLDGAGSEAVVPATATMTVSNLQPGEGLRHFMSFSTGSECRPSLLYNGAGASGNTFTAAGFPASVQRSGDIHLIGGFTTDLATSNSRRVGRYMKTLGDRTLTLPPDLPAPTVSSVSGSYMRLQVQYVQPGNYDGTAWFRYAGITQTMIMEASILGYIGSSAVNLTFPDLTGAGYDPAWAPPATQLALWTVMGRGSNNLPPCTEGAEEWEASRRGTF